MQIKLTKLPLIALEYVCSVASDIALIIACRFLTLGMSLQKWVAMLNWSEALIGPE